MYPLGRRRKSRVPLTALFLSALIGVSLLVVEGAPGASAAPTEAAGGAVELGGADLEAFRVAARDQCAERLGEAPAGVSSCVIAGAETPAEALRSGSAQSRSSAASLSPPAGCPTGGGDRFVWCTMKPILYIQEADGAIVSEASFALWRLMQASRNSWTFTEEWDLEYESGTTALPATADLVLACSPRCTKQESGAWVGFQPLPLTQGTLLGKDATLTNTGTDTASTTTPHRNTITLGATLNIQVVGGATTPLFPGIEDKQVRCDDENSGQGCVVPDFVPTLQLPIETFGPSAAFVRWAQQNLSGHWGLQGQGQPLTRIADDSIADANRGSICPGSYQPDPAVPNGSCDEFPFAKSWQSGAQNGASGANCQQLTSVDHGNNVWEIKLYQDTFRPSAKCARASIESASNSLVGGALGGQTTSQRLLDRDGYWVNVTGPTCPAALCQSQEPAAALTALALGTANRRAPVAGLYDWSKAGYRGGAALPGAGDITGSAACQITPAELDSEFDVRPDDQVDDTAGLQSAIDNIKTSCSAGASYTSLSLITLPAGALDVSSEISVDADYLIIRGAGSDPVTGTRLRYYPDENTRYDALTADGADWDEDGMEIGPGKGGWLWPGRGLFRVQSRGVHADYATDYASAPQNRKDIFEGTVNVHWKAGVKLREKPGDTGFAARTGDTVVYLASNAPMSRFSVGALVNIRAANSMNFYSTQQALPTDHPLQNLHMRQQIFRISAVNTSSKTITIDKPLEYDVPVTSISDGSAAIDGATYDSKASPITDPVVGVGLENLSFTQLEPFDPADAVHNYGNIDPAGEMHGIVFKWAADSWVRNVRAEMTGSHPIVTEEAKNLSIVNNYLDGSWNKGKGGNGYFRGSRVWDSVYAGNTTRNLRHFTFQWSASGNVAIGNSFDSDLNLHGGWERNNLLELNNVAVPFEHASSSCASNCGDEGGSAPDDSQWYPIWWAAGQKAVKWSGSSGPRNVFFNNGLTKQLGSPSGPYLDYYPDRHRIYQFGWSGSAWSHLDVNGTPIADWAHNEEQDYTGGHGVYDTMTDPGESLFLSSIQ